MAASLNFPWNAQGEVTRREWRSLQQVEPLTSFPSAALPGDEDALVLVLVPQRAVGLVRQGVAAGGKKMENCTN